ncbi:MAG: GNAT family N-acetyltransferase [Clostridia bacterium]|nr:GNAT family N-acetyltransferase [Clostridia bacterium]MBQ4085997.1 GNAT family N-acetyltransferase [Clostridia bacterium]
MKVSEFTIERLPDVLAFEQRLREEESFFNWEIGEAYQQAVRASFADRRFDGCISLLAEDEEGNVVGRIDCSMIPSRFDGSIKAYLDWICVLKSARHRGVAQALLSALRERLRMRGIDTLVALIASNEEAQRFYRNIEGAQIRDEGFWLTP